MLTTGDRGDALRPALGRSQRCGAVKSTLQRSTVEPVMRRAHSRWLRRRDGLRAAAAAQRGAALRASIRHRCRMRNLQATSGTASRDGLTGPQRVSSYAGLPIYSWAAEQRGRTE